MSLGRESRYCPGCQCWKPLDDWGSERCRTCEDWDDPALLDDIPAPVRRIPHRPYSRRPLWCSGGRLSQYEQWAIANDWASDPWLKDLGILQDDPP